MLPELGQLVDWKVWAWDWAVDFFPWTWAILGAMALFARGVRVWREELLGFHQVSKVVPLSLVFVIHCMSCMLEGVSDPWVLIGPIEGWSPTCPSRLLGDAPPSPPHCVCLITRRHPRVILRRLQPFEGVEATPLACIFFGSFLWCPHWGNFIRPLVLLFMLLAYGFWVCIAELNWGDL